MKISNIIYITLGFICLGLGIVGIFLPVLPTTPLLLLTSFCFSKGSDKFHHWFMGTSIYKKHLQSFIETRSMTLKTKFSILLPASILLLFPLIIIDYLIMKLFIIFLYVFIYYYFTFRIKTI